MNRASSSPRLKTSELWSNGNHNLIARFENKIEAAIARVWSEAKGEEICLMDEALELGSYLPQSFGNASEQSYLDFLWSAFQTNYETERFEFASLAFHLLYMSFVSFSIWQIRLARPDQFAMAMVGFRSDEEGSLMDCESPFKFYDRLKESQIFRFLKLIGCSNQQVGEFAKFVSAGTRSHTHRNCVL